MLEEREPLLPNTQPHAFTLRQPLEKTGMYHVKIYKTNINLHFVVAKNVRATRAEIHRQICQTVSINSCIISCTQLAPWNKEGNIQKS
jgi:hypothetical protein